MCCAVFEVSLAACPHNDAYVTHTWKQQVASATNRINKSRLTTETQTQQGKIKSGSLSTASHRPMPANGMQPLKQTLPEGLRIGP